MSKYRIDIQIPLRPRRLEVDKDLLIRQAELLQSSMSSACKGTAMVGVECDFWSRGRAVGSHNGNSQ